MINFLTLEDINGTIYENQDFYYHTIDTSVVTVENTPITIDFCKVTRTSTGYSVVIDNSYWAKGYYVLKSDGTLFNPTTTLNNNTLTITTSETSIKLYLYLGVNSYNALTRITYNLVENSMSLNNKQLQSNQDVKVYQIGSTTINTVSTLLTVGYNAISYNDNNCGFLLVKLLKSDFQFNCTQSLTLGKVNTVRLGVDTDYKPNGAMVGSNSVNIQVLYNDTYIPVRFDTSLNDYVFDIDLTNKQNESKVRLKVFVEANDVLNETETDIALDTSFETINNETKLQTLFTNGGIGRLGANITLTKDITVENSVLLLGNIKTLNMSNHKIIVPTDKTFKATETIFTNGKNTIQQNTGSTVELTACGFSDCTGFGSVIDCQTDLSSLSIENDFTTTITNCVFSNNDMCILHGGELNITGCEVTGKIGNPNNPYFLYQTDGNATILQSEFNLSSDTQIESDIEFNSCIFTCGETAIINGNSHDELQQNNINSFISNPQNNTSTINVTYYYPAIEDYITLESDNGYCHSCSDVDFVFKNNVTARRD